MDAQLVAVGLVVSVPLLFAVYKVYSNLTSLSAATKKKQQQGSDSDTFIGRGAPGFATGSKRVALPRELAERIRRGEEVSAEEVTAALERVQRGETEEQTQKPKDDFLPEGVATSRTASGSGSRRRKR